MHRPLPLLATVAVIAGLTALPTSAVAAPRPATKSPSRVEGRPSPLARSGHARDLAARTGALDAAPRSGVAHLDAAAVDSTPSRAGTVKVSVSGGRRVVTAAVHRLGGRVLVSANGTSSVVVAKTKLAGLASSSGVTRVAAVNKPYAQSSGPSEAVPATGADAWQQAGDSGAGVKFAIIDVGFGTSENEYDTQFTAGHLGADTQVVNEDCTDYDNIPTAFDGESHGLAVAELAQQQAPGAQLYLYCVGSPEGMADAAAAAHDAGVTIISSSLGWFDDSRGDGTGGAGSVATTVKTARQNGILWFNSTGNDVAQHWSGQLTDKDKNKFIDIGNARASTYPFESDFFYAAPGTAGAPSALAFYFQFDQWPSASSQLVLNAYGVQCTTGFVDKGIDGCNGKVINGGDPIQSENDRGGHPDMFLYTATNSYDFANRSAFPQIWQVLVAAPGGFPANAHYDLFALGDTYYASDLACPSNDPQGNCSFAPAAKSGSLATPSNSPYAVGVGAADVRAEGGDAAGTLEPFSSQGPTIDGRTKPEITGFDGETSYVPEFSDGFYGTSAATPVAAGSAALVQAADPTLDAAQIQNFLEQRAGAPGSPTNPPNNATGHGLLTLGATPVETPVAPPSGSRYASVAPTRILDTRAGYLPAGHKGALSGGKSVTVPVPALPADATAVAINLHGVQAKDVAAFYAYPSGKCGSSQASLNLSKTDPTVAVFVVVRPSATGTITICNTGASADVVVDEVGYFGTGEQSGRYTPSDTPARVFDSRYGVGGAKGQLAKNGTATVDPGAPAGASAAVVNLTAVNGAGSGFLNAAADCTLSSSTLNFGRNIQNNLAIVGLDPDGHFCIDNGSSSTDVVVDVLGFMGDTGSEYVALPAPQRIIDTRTGNGGSGGGHASAPLGAGGTATFYGANVGDVPAAATALLTSVADASATAASNLALYPGATKPASLTTSVNFTPGRIVRNAAIVGLSKQSGAKERFSAYNSHGSTHLVLDVFGYFAPTLSG